MAVAGALTVVGAIVGATLTSGGDIATTTTGNVSMTIDSTSYLTYIEDDCTATGSIATYETCNLENPKSFTGSIKWLEIQVSTAADTTAVVDCGVVANGATGSGTDIFSDEDLTAGVHAVTPGGTEVLLGPDQRVKCVTSSGTGQNLSAKIKTWMVEAEL